MPLPATYARNFLLLTTALLVISSPAEEHSQPTTAEHKILAALDEMTIVDFIEEPLDGVAYYLSDYHSIEIQIDVQALEDVNVGTDTPTTKSLENVTLRSALNLMLRDLDLAWIIKDDVLLITTAEVAKLHVIPRVYDVERLVTH